MALQASEFSSTPTRRIAFWLGLLSKARVSVHKKAILAAKTADLTPTPFSAAANATERVTSLLGDARPVRAVWGGAAMLAASLLLGIYIGVSGEAVLALCNTEMFASDNLGAGIVFSGSAF